MLTDFPVGRGDFPVTQVVCAVRLSSRGFPREVAGFSPEGRSRGFPREIYECGVFPASRLSWRRIPRDRDAEDPRPKALLASADLAVCGSRSDPKGLSGFVPRQCRYSCVLPRGIVPATRDRIPGRVRVSVGLASGRQIFRMAAEKLVNVPYALRPGPRQLHLPLVRGPPHGEIREQHVDQEPAPPAIAG